jgi:cell wall-associated NlpC family hydrolase
MLLATAPAQAGGTSTSRDTGVLGIRSEQLEPDFWLQRLQQPGRVVLDSTAIAAQKARLFAEDASMHDLSKLPVELPGEQVRVWIENLRPSFDRQLCDEDGRPLEMEELSASVETALNLPAIGKTVKPCFALAVQRTDLRAVPDRQRVFRSADDHDIDRWQESALLPGDAVAIVHDSADGQWAFVVSRNYAAWVERQSLACGPRDMVLNYVQRQPRLVVTGATVRTTFTPEEPRVSSLLLDMGASLPLEEWNSREPVNGQDAYSSYVTWLPVRDNDGVLWILPALIPRNADVAAGVLPLTQANIIGQAFKFLGERYGWGNSYGTRDCSGFVSAVYRSMGVELPRNTGDQAISPAFNRIAFDKDWDREKRLAVVKDTQPGDLIYIPGHVMLVIGHEGGQTWVIHDTTGASWLDADGERIHAKLNGVSVTPLEPMLSGESETYVDRITNIQRVRM